MLQCGENERYSTARSISDKKSTPCENVAFSLDKVKTSLTAEGRRIERIFKYCKNHCFITNVLIFHCRLMTQTSLNQSKLIVQEMSTKVCVSVPRDPVLCRLR